jgi:hypothetical protein
MIPDPGAHATDQCASSFMNDELENLSTTKAIEPFIRRTKHLLLVLGGYNTPEANFIMSFSNIELAVGFSAPSCVTIRVAVPFDLEALDVSRRRSERESLIADIPHSTTFLAAPTTFDGLKLAQQCIGHRLIIYDISEATAVSDDFEESWRAGTIYALAYAKDGKGDENIMWKLKQAVAMLPRTNLFYLLSGISKEQDWMTGECMTKKYGKMLKVLVGWQEKYVIS